MKASRRAWRAPAMPILAAMSILFACALSAQEYAEAVPDVGLEFRADPKDAVRITGSAGKSRTTASLKVTTNVANAEVYVDGAYRGLTPGVFDGVAPGIRRLEIRKAGYYRKAWIIKVEAGSDAAVYAELSLVTGILTVTGLPKGGVILIDQTPHDAGKTEIPAGQHAITLRAFGYDERTETVLIEPRKETTIEANLAKAVFEAKDIRVSRAAFNPENPEALGCVDIFFSVSAPGSGTLAVSDERGETVYEARLGPFDSWAQTARWNGKDGAGKAVGDGRYAIRIDAAGTDGESGQTAGSEKRTLASAVTVDRSIAYPVVGSLFGTGSFGPVVSAALMPAGGAAARVEIGGAGSEVSFGISATAGILKHLEAGFEAGALRSVFGAGNAATATALGAAIKSGLTFGNLSVAGALRYSAVLNALTDTGLPEETRRGLALGPAIEYRIGPVAAGANAEIQCGDAFGYLSKPYLTAAGGIDVSAAGGIFACGIFAGARTAPLAGGEAREAPPVFSAGATARVFVPTTNLVVTARAGACWNAAGTAVPEFAGGFGFVF